MNRNTDGLRKSARERHQLAVRKADAALATLLEGGKPVTFRNVSQVAGVSTAWLYSQVGLRKRIEDLRLRRLPGLATPRNEVASDQSKDSIISALKLRVRALEDKNRDLTRQIEVAYGRLFAVKPD